MEMTISFITAHDKAEALSIGRALVEKKLASKVKIIDGVHSLVLWQGKVGEGDEVLILAESDLSRIQALTADVEKLSSFSTPCVVTLLLNEVNEPFRQWMEGSVKYK